MARNLYRFYLYVVFTAMLIFAAVGLAQLLQPLLAETPLRGNFNSPPTSASIVQGVVFFVVSWFVAALLGGLHYWLIRRDMQSDPLAGRSGIRAFFLNITELIAMPVAIGFSAFLVIQNLGQFNFDSSGPAAFSLALLALVAVIELERRRAEAVSGAALVFQRLHLYGVQLILLFELTTAWIGTVKILVGILVYGGTGSVPQGTSLGGMVAATLWIMLFWLGYGFFARNDITSMLRYVLHLLSFAYGVGFILFGVERGIELVFLALFRVAPSQSDILNNYDFTSPITFGLLTIGVYIFWLRMANRQEPARAAVTFLTVAAIAAFLLAVAFWWGSGLVVLNLLESVSGGKIGPRDWATALALVITGLAYIPFDLYLRRRNAQDPSTASVPRRGFVFVMLGGGILTGGIGAAVTLYALGTALLGSPLGDWQHVARSGSSALIVGAIIVGIYLWAANRERLLAAQAKPPTPTPTIKVPLTIEDVLDELLAGKITRDAAAARIRAITDLQATHQ